MKTVSKVLIAAMVFSGLALPVSVNAQDDLGCYYLHLTVPDNYRITTVNCTKGAAETVGQHSAWLRQVGAYGPECQINLQPMSGSGSTGWHCGFTVHQKYCLFQAGDVSITDISCSDQPVYTITRGQFMGNNGKIVITGFN